MGTAVIWGIVVGVVALLLLIRVSYRIFVVDKKLKRETYRAKEDSKSSHTTDQAESNAEVFDGTALHEITEEGPYAWYLDVDPPSPRRKEILGLTPGQAYLNFKNQCEIAMTNLPVPLQQRSAFSVKFISGVQGTVSVGLSWKPSPNELPGHFIRSVGLVNDGFVYSGQKDVWRRTFNGSFQDGDTLTVLVDRSKGQVQWLKNGDFVIDAQQVTNDVPISMSLPGLRLEKGWANNVAIFPAIGLQGSVVVECNFGKEGATFPGLKEHDDLVFGRGDIPAGIEDALEDAHKKSAPSLQRKNSGVSPSAAASRKSLLKRMPTNAMSALEEGSGTSLGERMAKLRSFRMLGKRKHGAFSEDADRLQARFQEAMSRKGIDASSYLSRQCAPIHENPLREAAAALEVNVDRCRFPGCLCKHLCLPDFASQMQADPGNMKCKVCGHSSIYHRKPPGRRFTNIAEIEDGQERACEILAGSGRTTTPKWRRAFDIDGTPRFYNVDTGEITSADCPDLRVASTLALVKPTKEQRDKLGKKSEQPERPKRTRPIHTWYIEQQDLSPTSVKSSRRTKGTLGMGGRKTMQEVVDAINSPKSPSSPVGGRATRTKLGHSKTEPVGSESPISPAKAAFRRASRLALGQPTGSSSDRSGEVESLKDKAEPFMNKWKEKTPEKKTSVSALSVLTEDLEGGNPV